MRAEEAEPFSRALTNSSLVALVLLNFSSKRNDTLNADKIEYDGRRKIEGGTGAQIME